MPDFSDFIMSVPQEHQIFVKSLHDKLTDLGCKIKVKAAKSGYAVSYQYNQKAIMNWVFRKAGILARIYGDHVGMYENIVSALPADMQRKMTASRDCKRLLDPASCSDTCVKGFVYRIGEETFKKCRNDGMFFLLDKSNESYIQALVEAEISARQL